DITDSEFPANILKMIGHQVNTVDKQSLKCKKFKSNMKPVGKAMVTPTVVSKPGSKVKTTYTLKPTVFFKSSNTQKGESSNVFQKQKGISDKVDKKVVKVVDKGNQKKGKSQLSQIQKNISRTKATGLKHNSSSPSVASKSLEEKIQKRKVFYNKQHVKRVVKMASLSDDEFYDNFSSKQFSKQNVNSNSFWKFRYRPDDNFFVRKDECLEDGSSSSSSKPNGRRLFRETQRQNGGSHPF
ncbi:hypothetical protein R6Q59_010252, partial [Mikania micrantha]